MPAVIVRLRKVSCRIGAERTCNFVAAAAAMKNGAAVEATPSLLRQNGTARQSRRCGQSYLAAISASVVSSMRLEKPHSLSYQLNTFTKVPSITRVWVLS